MRHVEVWRDKTSEPRAHWIVSLEDGWSSRTLAQFAGTERGRTLARKWAMRYARAKGLIVREIALRD